MIFAALRSLLCATVRQNVREKLHCANWICQQLGLWFNYWTHLYLETNKHLTKKSREEYIKNVFTANMPFSLYLKCACWDLLISNSCMIFSSDWQTRVFFSCHWAWVPYRNVIILKSLLAKQNSVWSWEKKNACLWLRLKSWILQGALWTMRHKEQHPVKDLGLLFFTHWHENNL